MNEPVVRLSEIEDSGFPEVWYEIASADHFWLEWRFRAFCRLLDDLGIDPSKPMHGLDIGCGNGVVRRQMESFTSWSSDGADLNEQALLQNGVLRGDTYFYDIHDRRPELRERYDFVVLFDVLEHIDDTRHFLESSLYHLRPGGWLFINVPALELFRGTYDRFVGHLRRYTRRTLRAELRGFDFVERHDRYWGFSMLPYLLIRELLSAGEKDVRAVVEQGLQPPAAWTDRWIRRIMRAELALLARPPLGTSLLCAARKGSG